MFLLNRDIFFWDLAILLLLSLGFSAAMAASLWLRRAEGRHILHRMTVGTVGLVFAIGFLLTAYGSFVDPHLLLRTR